MKNEFRPKLRGWTHFYARYNRAVERNFRYFLVAPAVILIIGLIVYPLLYNLYLSLHEVTLLNIRREWDYVGLQNYLRVFRSDATWRSLFSNNNIFNCYGSGRTNSWNDCSIIFKH